MLMLPSTYVGMVEHIHVHSWKFPLLFLCQMPTIKNFR